MLDKKSITVFEKPTPEESCQEIRKFLDMLFLNVSAEIDLSGHYIEVRLINHSGPAKRYFFSAKSGLEQSLNSIVKESFKNDCNVYIGLALRDSNISGKNSDCSLISLLVVDYDEIDGVKIKSITNPSDREKTQQKILDLLEHEAHYPPTMIVNSGNGFHAYYCLAAMVDVRENAQSIKAKSKWLADRYSNCPGDPAMQRISQPIRLPGSLNLKDLNKIKFCHIVDYFPERKYVFSEIPESKIEKISVKCAMPKGHITESISKYPFWDCVFLKWMRENPNDQPYLLWFGAASTLAYFGEEGRATFHELSHGYPDYNESESNDLFDKMFTAHSEGIGPLTYEKLSEYGFTEKDETDAASPAIYIERLYTDHNLAKMGITFKGEDRKMCFNANIFSDYIIKRYQLLIHEGAMFYEYNAGVWSPLPEYQLVRKIRDIVQDAKKNMYMSWLGTEALTILKLAVPEAPSMDTHKGLVNVVNGMIDICSNEFLPHKPSYLSTVQIPLTYDPHAKCKRFTQFVNEIMDGDPERIAVVQEFFGYLLTAETIIHKAFFLFGEGSNGKSLLLDILTVIIGSENVSNLSLVDLDNSFRRSNLIGKTANIATENEIKSKGFNSQYFKAIVSGDRIQVEKKYENSISYSPICKLVFAVNNLPYSPDKTHGLYRRLLIIPFDRRFDGKHADVHLREKLVVELPGILNWALIGLKRLREHDYEFTESKIINNALVHYIQDQNPMGNYISEMIEKSGPNDRVAKAAIMEGYYFWCRRNGLGDVTKTSPQKFWNTFKSNCKELGLPFEQQVSNGVRYLKTLTLRNTDDQITNDIFGLTKIH